MPPHVLGHHITSHWTTVGDARVHAPTRQPKRSKKFDFFHASPSTERQGSFSSLLGIRWGAGHEGHGGVGGGRSRSNSIESTYSGEGCFVAPTSGFSFQEESEICQSSDHGFSSQEGSEICQSSDHDDPLYEGMDMPSDDTPSPTSNEPTHTSELIKSAYDRYRARGSNPFGCMGGTGSALVQPPNNYPVMSVSLSGHEQHHHRQNERLRGLKQELRHRNDSTRPRISLRRVFAWSN